MTNVAVQGRYSESQLRVLIAAALLEVALSCGAEVVEPLSDDLALLESGLDSLGFAILVARLEEDLGWDPFSLSDQPFYPVRFGEFVAFYEANQP
ncbi:acyl carrier protein [Sphingomonas sp. BIUV-7]|uniref:Acyl carrier protein n=1 Tax=Sphingomonas natans TaxID=3063330 RepID=A0ABT8YCW5_9SPHN|nr:acyl carrier protein [Sphingomonas sp. BIUV-7]MDO6416182.1 acyl carrier protein [Sphingomonas sp. BIUV-7]